MDPFGPKYQDQVLPRIFDAEHINKLQQFEWSIVQCNITVPGDYNGSPKRKNHVANRDLQMLAKDY
jgi:hypothetical protein